jgi:hypothetical protein
VFPGLRLAVEVLIRGDDMAAGLDIQQREQTF